MARKYKLAIIGSGSLGSTVGKVVFQTLSDEYDITGVMSGKIENAIRLADQLGCKAYKHLDEMINDQPDYVVEAATASVFKALAVKILSNGISLIPLSVGALADQDFYRQVKEAAKSNNCRVHISAGAVGGFDVLRASMLMGAADVSITTEKSPESLDGAPILADRKLSQEQEEEVFTGKASEAIQHFPKNVNVAVATALATAGVEDTKVTVRSIPGFESNRHRIHLEGETVKVDVIVETRPSEANPKSSTLAAYSVIALLQNLASPITF